jgi:hypothetical protein
MTMAARGRLALVLAGVLALSGCAGNPVPPVVGQRCEGVPAHVCADIIAGAHENKLDDEAGIAGIWIRCAAQACTEEAGEAAFTVTYLGGRTLQGSQDWMAAAPAGVNPAPDPTPLPMEPVCVGVAQGACLERAAEGIDLGLPGNPVPVSILVRCTTTCGPDNGDGETVVRWADGTSNTTSWSYRSGE